MPPSSRSPVSGGTCLVEYPFCRVSHNSPARSVRHRSGVGWVEEPRELGSSGLRGWRRATDRHNLPRVMPAKGGLAMTSGSADVVIVGGGAIGLAVAWRAALAGLRVQACDPSLGGAPDRPAPGQWSSWAAAGMLAPVTEIHYGEEPLLVLNLDAADRWPAFADELEERSGVEVGYRRTGTLLIARDTDDNAALEDLYRYQVEIGVEVERLGSRACRQLEPRLAPRVRGGVHVPGDHQVDNRALMVALRVACARAGVALAAGAVAEVLVERERATGVRLASGDRVAAEATVLAAGCWSGTIAGIPNDLLPPIRPVKG